MGLSPYYLGADCNFWALYDNNPHLVGATIHMLTKGLDNGPILYHALSNLKSNPFEYTMSTVMSAFKSISERIKNETIFKIKPEAQNKKIKIRYSTKKEFDDEVIIKFFSKKIDLYSKNFNFKLYKNPFVLEE
jgi:methionyl-tRNA formyltransferase